jgi:hypothetical protein
MFAGINLLKQTRPQRPTGRRALWRAPAEPSRVSGDAGVSENKTLSESKTPLENTPHLASAGDAVYPLTAFVKDRFGNA